MKIGLILSAIPSYSETFIKNKIIGLIENGHKISLFVTSEVDSTSIHNAVSIYRQVNVKYKFNLLIRLISILILYPLRCFRFLRLEVRSHDDSRKALKNLIINSHIIGKPLDWIHFCFATTSLGRENLAWAMRVKSAVSFRGFDIGLYPHQHPGCYNLLWNNIDKVHTISDDLYQKAIDLGLDPETPYKKITPAINADFFNSNMDEDLHGPLRILTVGRLTWKKGYEYALKALRLLKDNKINFKYHVVGDGHYREAIVYAIHQLQLTENVQLVGQISPDAVKDEMEWADIYIQPSIQEGFCNAVLEAQAMGLLCVVTDADGLSENIIHDETGWIVKKRNPKAIYNRIIKIRDYCASDRNNITHAARERVKKEFDLTIQNRLFNSFYD